MVDNGAGGVGGDELIWLILSAASKAWLFDLIEIGMATPLKAVPTPAKVQGAY